jgi:non-specific serine/threonine protein kinase
MEECLKRARIALRPYQRAGIHWLNWLRQSYLHGILADDMGLGKTIQAICAMRLAYEQTDSTQHSLVLCPSSVMVHWKREIDRCFPEIRTIIYHGPVWRRGYLNAKRASVFISTYATAANDWEHLARVPFFYLILDEATQIKNPDAGRTKAAKSLNAVHRLALSGTPVENRHAELWSIFDFLMRGFLGRYGTFVNSFEIPIMQGDKPTADQLGTRIRPFLLRRLKAEVEKDLPPKIEIDEWCELTEEQRQIYGSQQAAAKQVIAQLRQGEYVNYATSILPLLVILKQVCDHPAIFNGQHEPLFGRSHKFDAIIDKTVQITSAGEQVVVFSHFLKMLDLLEEAISQHGIEYMRNRRQYPEPEATEPHR